MYVLVPDIRRNISNTLLMTNKQVSELLGHK